MKRTDKKARFIKTLKQVMNSYPRNTTDTRPTTGNVGQRCLGYVEDNNGKLIRLAPKIKPEECIGPGTYDPYKYEKFGRKSVLSRNSKRTNFILTDYCAGPADYFVPEAVSKILHAFGPDDRSKIKDEKKIQPPLSGELSHESWIKEPPKPPKNRFPQTKFAKQKSAAFANKEKRVLFEEVSDIPGPGEYETAKNNKIKAEEEGSSIFKNRLDRFPEFTTIAPSPCTYTLPSYISDGPAYSLHPLMETVPKQKEITPSPGQYRVEPVKVVINKKTRPERGYQSVLGDNIERRKPEKERYPTKFYDVCDKELADTIPRVIRSKRNTPGSSWIPESETPGPGSYNPRNDNNKAITPTLRKSSRPKNPELDRYMDSWLAFNTLHNDFIIKSSNKNYNKDLENWR
jgi:hypothetical protein